MRTCVCAHVDVCARVDDVRACYCVCMCVIQYKFGNGGCHGLRRVARVGEDDEFARCRVGLRSNADVTALALLGDVHPPVPRHHHDSASTSACCEIVPPGVLVEQASYREYNASFFPTPGSETRQQPRP